MKIKINRTLFKFEMEYLFASKHGLVQFAFIQFILWFSTAKLAEELFKGVSDYWFNYILIRGFCVTLLLNAIVSMELFLKPKIDKTIEMMLAAGLSPQAIVISSVAASIIYNAVSLIVYFCLLAFSIDRFTFDWVHLISFTTLILANLATLIVVGFFSLQTKYSGQISVVLIISSILLLSVTGLYNYSVNPTTTTQAVLIIGAALMVFFSSLMFKYFDKEKILLS